MTPRDWRGRVARHAESTGIHLSRETVDELAAHLEDIYLSARADGHPDSAARQKAQRALEASGLLPLCHEPRLDTRRSYHGLAHDVVAASRHRSLAMLYALRMAFRQLRLHPAFSVLTLLVLGLGTGAATVVYTIVDTVVLRALPYGHPDRLVKLWDTNPEGGIARDPISPVTFMDYRALPEFKDAAAWWRPDVNLVDPGLDPVRVHTIETSANLFQLLGVSPQVGPGFPREERLHNPSDLQAVISDRLWRTRYHADASVIGRQLSFNDTPYTIVGIMPPGFRFPDDVDVWQRLSWDLSQHSRNAHFMEGVARMADGVTLEQATTAARALATRLGGEFAASNKGWAFAVVPLLEDQLGYYQPALYVLFGAVGLLLVIGCLNVASLLLTRALSREREMAVRTAVGAAPRQIVTQLIGESLMLSLAGALVGLVVAFAALPLVVAFVPVEVPRLAEAAINGRVLGLALGLVVAMTMVFGLVPSLVLLSRQIGSDLRSGDRGSSRGARRLYQGLVIAEVALACALLVSSALLVRTVRRMMQVPLGVDGGSSVVASVQLTPDSGSLAAWAKVGSVHTQILERLREQPGIASAGGTNRLPIENGWRGPLARPDQVAANPNDLPQAQHISVSEGYFETMGAHLVEGRFFTDRDAPDAEAVVILNQTAARRYFGAESAIGRELRSWSSQIGPLGRNLTWRELPGGHRAQPGLRVVGVVADIQNVALGLPVEPAAYFPTRQFPFAAVTLAINARDPATAVAALKQVLQQVSPHTPIGQVETWSARFATRTAEPRLLMSTLSAFGALAAFLAALGVYGLFSWSVALRRRELAIRLTLGARPVVVASSVIRQSALLVVVGLLAGFALVQGARHLLASVLFGVEPNDPASTMVAGAFLFLAALLASLPPAWRAMRVDPVDGLRVE
jgi:putative ABC transport system permease protein